jgi:hypothetical protein
MGIQMTQALTIGSPAQGSRRTFRLFPHLLGGLAVAALSLIFSGGAGIFALLTGYVIAGNVVARRSGPPSSHSATVLRIVAIPAGIVGMLFFTSLLGFVMAQLIVVVPVLSERATIGGTASQQTIARIWIAAPTLAILGGLTLLALLTR